VRFLGSNWGSLWKIAFGERGSKQKKAAVAAKISAFRVLCGYAWGTLRAPPSSGCVAITRGRGYIRFSFNTGTHHMRTHIFPLFLLLFVVTGDSPGQQDTTWQQWNWLIGEWVGEGSGSPGEGGGWFSLTPDLGGKILVRKNHAEYPAAGNRPRSVHDDLMIVYRDSVDQPTKAIYFDNEGHIINYSITYPDRAIVFTSERVGNAPIFRLSYRPLEPDVINIAFEISKDGERFMTYMQGKCRRRKQR
jgi:hypothetical protein